MAPSHYLNQCWNIVNWTFRKKRQWNSNRNSYIFIQEIAFQNAVCEMAFTLSRSQCVEIGHQDSSPSNDMPYWPKLSAYRTWGTKNSVLVFWLSLFCYTCRTMFDKEGFHCVFPRPCMTTAYGPKQGPRLLKRGQLATVQTTKVDIYPHNLIYHKYNIPYCIRY